MLQQTFKNIDNKLYKYAGYGSELDAPEQNTFWGQYPYPTAYPNINKYSAKKKTQKRM